MKNYCGASSTCVEKVQGNDNDMKSTNLQYDMCLDTITYLNRNTFVIYSTDPDFKFN